MKPIRRIFCIGCRHPKLAFASKEKADRYIKFNHETLARQSGKIPCRSYYCSFCCAWHVTSVSELYIGEKCDSRDRRRWEVIAALEDLYPSDKGNSFEKYHDELLQLFNKAFDLFAKCETLIILANLEDALASYTQLQIIYSTIRLKIRPKNLFPEKMERLKLHLSALEKTFRTIEEFDNDSTSRKTFLCSDSIPKDNLAIDYFLAKEKTLRKEL